jgi:AcrR family transcriptional regulator
VETAVSSEETRTAAAPGGAERRLGRPRSERADHAIIDATLDLFAEGGVQAVCVEAVAAKAGVGKATIYRRWPGKEELLIDALASLKSPYPRPAGNGIREDLIAIVDVIAEDASDPRHYQQYGLWFTESVKHPGLAARFKETVVEPRREVIRGVLRQGIAAGELRPDIDIELVMLMLVGAVMTCGRSGAEPFPPGFSANLVDELLTGIAAR